MTATSSGTGYFGPVQHVELSAFRAGVPLTMSGYVRTNNPKVYFRHDYIGGVTGIQAPDPIPADGGWHYVTWTVDTTGTSTIPIFQVLAFNYGIISITNGDYIEIADMQLEVGKVATPFEHRSYGEELALCQRYYYKLGGVGGVDAATSLSSGSMYTSTAVNLYVPFPVPMRATPGISKTVNGTGNWLNLYVGSTGTVGNPTPQVGDNGTDSARVYITSAHSGNSPSAAGAGVWAVLLSGASLNFSAEL